ncbi:unannotated protein [freshwater metagenome]|uniref:Unannotated protein n=1 Tax=freshwater metagenome TaxID=449393 RepID=A0A6J7FXK2_9ZZZZ
MVTVMLPMVVRGARGMRPNVAFSPNSPVNPAGIRMEPPPSPPVARVISPPDTAAAVPPLEPPGVCSVFHGLRVAPCSTVRVRLTPPNSLLVVCPASTAPPMRLMRSTITEVWVETTSAKTTHASVAGQPVTASSSLTPIGTPPKGNDTSALLAASSACSRGV